MAEISVLQAGSSFSIEQAIRTAAAAFNDHGLSFGHGTDDAIAEASWLIQFALGRSPLDVPNYPEILTDAARADCNAVLVRRIAERIPAAYITGTAWFAGLAFRSDQRALVPRSPLAEFILEDFFGLLPVGEPVRVLDLCTGGGCIAIACATALPQARVDASDLSTDALELAALNVADHGLGNRVSLIHSNLFDNITDQYDLIISNPPYVDKADIESMGTEFEHEPLMGLAAGDDGLDLVREMLFAAPNYLTDQGVLVVEVGNSAQAVEREYPDIEFEWLEFENGGMGVFAIRNQVLRQHHTALAANRRA